MCNTVLYICTIFNKYSMEAIPKSKLTKLRNELRGNIKKIADANGWSFSYVSMVLNGHTHNEKILRACIEKRNEIVNDKRKELKKLVAQI